MTSRTTDHRPLSFWFPSKPIVLLATALAVWGIWLAVGATGWFGDRGLFDLRRTAIVLSCSLAFLTFWFTALYVRARSVQAASEKVSGETSCAGNWQTASRPTSRAAVASVAGGVLMLLVGVAARTARSPELRTAAGWTALLLFLAAGVAALVALSDPRRPRLQLLGLLTLALQLVAILLVFAGV